MKMIEKSEKIQKSMKWKVTQKIDELPVGEH